MAEPISVAERDVDLRSRSSNLSGSSMNVKRSIAAVALTGGVAAVIFGGTSVSTAFTDHSEGSVVANAATFGGTYTTGDLRIDGALPGDTNSEVVSYKNNGST